MATCGQCGASLNANQPFCRECGAPTSASVPASGPAPVPPPTYPPPASSAPPPGTPATEPDFMQLAKRTLRSVLPAAGDGGVAPPPGGEMQVIPGLHLSDGEMRVRNYHFANRGLSWFGLGSKGRCQLMVTNKRVICYSRSNSIFDRSEGWQEVPIESVGCANFVLIRKFPIIGILIMAFLTWGTYQNWNAYVAIIPAAITLFLFLNRNAFAIAISSSQAHSNPISVGGSNLRGTWGWIVALVTGYSISIQSAGIFQDASPTPTTAIMMHEVGAMILDIKTQGDRGAEKWRQ